MLECSADEIKQIHALLVQGFRPQLTCSELAIDSGETRSTEWEKKAFEGESVFVLWDKGNPHRTEIQRRRTQIVELAGFGADADETGWVSWREIWRKKSRDAKLTLKDAAFTFYWGRAYNNPVSVFRAEWSEKQYGAADAAHPHWHLDHEPLGTQLQVGRIHFGMAGWLGGGDCPSCWQLFAKQSDELRNWAIRTLEYARLQLNEYPPAAAPSWDD